MTLKVLVTGSPEEMAKGRVKALAGMIEESLGSHRHMPVAKLIGSTFQEQAALFALGHEYNLDPIQVLVDSSAQAMQAAVSPPPVMEVHALIVHEVAGYRVLIGRKHGFTYLPHANILSDVNLRDAAVATIGELVGYKLAYERRGDVLPCVAVTDGRPYKNVIRLWCPMILAGSGGAQKSEWTLVPLDNLFSGVDSNKPYQNSLLPKSLLRIVLEQRYGPLEWE